MRVTLAAKKVPLDFFKLFRHFKNWKFMLVREVIEQKRTLQSDVQLIFNVILESLNDPDMAPPFASCSSDDSVMHRLNRRSTSG